MTLVAVAIENGIKIILIQIICNITMSSITVVTYKSLGYEWLCEGYFEEVTEMMVY